MTEHFRHSGIVVVARRLGWLIVLCGVTGGWIPGGLAKEAALAATGKVPPSITEPTSPLPKDWCGTLRAYQKKLAAKGLRDVPCPSTYECDDPAGRDMWLPATGDYPEYFNVVIHVFAKNDWSDSTATPAKVAGQMATTNASYAPYGLQFTYSVRYDPDSRFRDLDTTEIEAMKNIYVWHPDSALNVYVVDLDASAGFAAVGTFPWDLEALGTQGGIVIDMESFGYGLDVLSHEIGHCLGLWHTFRGVSEGPLDGDWACLQCYEGVGGTDHDVVGDFCSDTPPTPMNRTCNPPGSVDSCNGNASWGTTDLTNFMGYGGDGCWNHFTEQQTARMHCWTHYAMRGWRNCNVIDPAVCGEYEKTSSSTLTQAAHAIALSNAGGYWLAGARGDKPLLMRLNGCGDVAQSSLLPIYATDYSYVAALQPSDAGGCLAAGVYRNYSSVYRLYSTGMFLFGLDPCGDTLWKKSLGRVKENIAANSMEKTADGNYVVAGYRDSASFHGAMLMKINESGGEIWRRYYSKPSGYWKGTSAKQTPDGGFVFVGNGLQSGHFDTGLLIVRTNSQGDTMWTRLFGGSQPDEGKAVACMSDGSFLTAGYTESYGSGWKDIYLLKISATGDLLWSRTYGGSSDDEAFSMESTSDGGFVVAGYTSLGGTADDDTYIIRLDAAGNTLWTRTMGGDGGQQAFAVKQDVDGGFLVVGVSGDDVYVAKVPDLPPPCVSCGDANSSGTINISDAVFIVAYIFASGTAPGDCNYPLGKGDANGSGTVNISDAVFLIAYIFAGGAAPRCM